MNHPDSTNRHRKPIHELRTGPRETLTLEAEPAVLRKITTETHGRRLLIGLAPDHIETQQPIRMKLGVWTLRALESRAAGAISIGGAGSYSAPQLVNERAEVPFRFEKD